MQEREPSRAIGAMLWIAAGAWVAFWLCAYAWLEVPRQFSGATRPALLLGEGYAGLPWPVVGAAALTALFACAFAQIGGWLAARLCVSALTPPGWPTRRLYALEEWAVSFTFGAVAAGLVILALGLAGVWFPAIVFPVLIVLSAPLWVIVPFALAMAAIAAARGKIRSRFLRRPPVHSTLSERCLIGAGAALLLFGLLYALTPPIQSDGLRYHLAAPQEYLKAGRIAYLPYSAFSNFPFLVEMLFTLAMAAVSDLAAKGIHWLFLVVSALWVFLLVAQIMWWRQPDESPAPRRGALAALAALAFIATPTVLITGCWEFIDLGVAALFFAFIYALARWTHNRQRGWLGAAGVFGAGCLGVKYTMIPLVGLGGLWVAAMSLAKTDCDPAKPARVALRRFVFVMGVAGALGAPWYLKNLAMTGNPVYPLAWGVFKGGDWNAANAAFYADKAAGKGFTRQIKSNPAFIPSALIQLPFATAFRWRQEAPRPEATTGWGGFEDHSIGVGYLLLLPFIVAWMALVAWRWRRDPVRAMIALFMLAYAILWFFTYQSNRFLIPLLGLACVVAADCARAPQVANQPCARGGFSLSRWVWIAALAASALNAAFSIRWIAADATHPSPLPVVLGIQSRDAYLQEALPQYRLISNLHKIVNDNAGVLFVGEHRVYYCQARCLASDWFDTPRILALIRETPDNDALFARLLCHNDRYVFFNFDELDKYIKIPQLFRNRFTDAEWSRFEDFCDSPRLRRRIADPDNPNIYLVEIIR